ncbi:MAG: DNA polymerase III subunit alpha, partial [Bacteroidota bacterium]|nr:DNA polymerase III subunit alpha [Bacteroidota bacterium]
MSVEELLSEAQLKGVRSFVLADINNTSACLDYIKSAGKYDVKPIVGIDFREGVQARYIGIAKNNEGFLELNQHLTAHLSEQQPISRQAPEFANSFVVYPFNSIHPRALREYEYIGIRTYDLNKLPFSEAKNFLHKMVVLHPVTFRNKKDFNAHRLLRAIHNNTLLSKLAVSEQTVETEVMHTESELSRMFEYYPQLIRNTKKILEECEISFEYGKSKNKISFNGSISADHECMRRLCYEGIHYRFPNPGAEVFERMDKELEAIFSMNFCSYFLINHDIINYARHKNYFYIGRGSGANSLAAYCMRITDVDPIGLDLYFERFINPYRVNPPDFDMDFSWKDRDDITRYIFEKHGQSHTALVATYNTFQYNSVIRELGKVFGLPKSEIDEVAENRKAKQTPDTITSLIFKYSRHIHDFPNHLSVHAGGILISEKPINYYTATGIPPKGYPLTQFSMLEAEDIGLYKFDIL